MRVRTLSLLIGVLLATGCSDLTSPESLAGTWKQADTFPGNSLMFTLDANGDAISGSGTWSGEACCDGTVTITGNSSAGSVSLGFAFVTRGSAFPPPRSSHFTGRLTGRNTIVGTYDGDASATEVVFLRTN